MFAILVILQCIHGYILYSRCISDVAMPTYVYAAVRLSPRNRVKISKAQPNGRRQIHRQSSTSFWKLCPSTLYSKFFIFAETIHCTAFCTPGAFVILQLARIHARTYVLRTVDPRWHRNNRDYVRTTNTLQRLSHASREDNPSKIVEH